MYPENDNQFEETLIKKVEQHSEDHFVIKRSDGWDFYFHSPDFTPAKGMSARFYGRGIGSSVRGLFIEGTKIFYRTEEEEKEHQRKELYGETCEEYLNRWDNGRSVWSIEMGGLGPGYEQAIQVTFIEILRHLLEKKYDSVKWTDQEAWNKDKEDIHSAMFKNEKVEKLGLSGAQFSAALNLATIFYVHGPVNTLVKIATKERRIQISKNFPC
jgi:hypothetical protein